MLVDIMLQDKEHASLEVYDLQLFASPVRRRPNFSLSLIKQLLI